MRRSPTPCPPTPKSDLSVTSQYEDIDEVFALALHPPNPHATVAVHSFLETREMRELTVQEKDEVSGGILPLIGFGLAVAAKAMGSGGVTGWAISSASLVVASYGLAAAYGPGSQGASAHIP